MVRAAMSRVRVAFLWHMHQPLYREPESGDVLMPWVRLHATRAYYDMAWMLERHPRIRCTVNFTPVLLEQLDDYVAGRARDRFLDLTARPAADLSPDDRQALLRSFFMVDWETNVRPLPRYWELLHKRGRDLRAVDLPRVAATFTDEELTDLQVLFNLAWVGFGGLADDEGLRRLREKGREFTREDVEVLLAAQRRLLAEIVPRWRALASRGQVELSTTPYHHPILPLLCDTDVAHRALPGIPLPPRFAHPEDARWHVRAAIEAHARWFGAPPAGMWPAEGAVSPEALEILATEGLSWAASDEGVLLHSLPPDAIRGRSLYRPWRVQAGAGELRMLFRDRPISDLVGFTYARVPAREAARDFVARLEAVGASWAARGEPDRPTVGVFLDGENAWEHYPSSGHDFLDALYAALEERADLETVTLSEAVAAAGGPAIPRIHTGSWIESSFRIWIGHSEDRTAWTALGRVRAALAAAEADGVPRERIERARAHLLAAEGSDWYWWYGEDFTTELAAEFDSLFRGHVVRAALLLGAPPPAEALAPIKRAGAPAGVEAKPLREPTQLVTPSVDGRETSFFEWQGAGLYRPGQHRGSMYGAAQAFHVLRFGFDLDAFYLRLDPVESAARTAEVATALRVTVLSAEVQTSLDHPLVPDGVVRPGVRRGEAIGRCAFAQVLEIAIPFQALGLVPHAKVALTLHVLRGDVEVERLPRYGFVTFAVPGSDFEGTNWSA
jgi:alpha-amylase/alpha-mannosidase (GH57 family)